MGWCATPGQGGLERESDSNLSTGNSLQLKTPSSLPTTATGIGNGPVGRVVTSEERGETRLVANGAAPTSRMARRLAYRRHQGKQE